MRVVVEMFAEAMERKLVANDDKGGRSEWKGESSTYLLKRLREEVDELEEARADWGKALSEAGPKAREMEASDSVFRAWKQAVLDEAADVANFAMFIADEVGTLPMQRLKSKGTLSPAEIEVLTGEATLPPKPAKLEWRVMTPVPMLIWCPKCGARHLDEGIHAVRAHRDHACQSCGLVWRPALVPTVGVRFLPGYKNGTEDPNVVDPEPII